MSESNITLPFYVNKDPAIRYEQNRKGEALGEALGNYELLERVQTIKPFDKQELELELSFLVELKRHYEKALNIRNDDYSAYLFERIRTQENYIVEHHLRLVPYVIAKYFGISPLDLGSSKPGDRKGLLGWADLFQIGYLGLVKAVKRVNTPRKTFPSYAISCIKYEIIREFKEQEGNIRYPSNIHRQLTTLKKAQDRLLNVEGIDFSVGNEANYAWVSNLATQMLSEELDISPGELRELLKLQNYQYSLDRLFEEIEKQDPELKNLKFDPENPYDNETDVVLEGLIDKREVEQSEPDAEIERIQTGSLLKEAILALNERERVIIEERFGLKDGQPKTLEETAKALHTTRERVRKIESKALSKLRGDRLLTEKLINLRDTNSSW